MSTTPAGWYQDPENAQGLRWWDGIRWTTDTSARPQPYQAGGVLQQARAPASADWRTPWIWVVLLLPLLPILGLFFVDWRSLLSAYAAPSSEGMVVAQFAVLTSPGYLVAAIGGWIAYALAVVFAFLDWKTLRDRGVPRPFHWAWTFLSSYVYAIGRGVVTHRRGAGGRMVMWVAIALLVAVVIGSLIFSGWIIALAVDEVSRSPYYSTY